MMALKQNINNCRHKYSFTVLKSRVRHHNLQYQTLDFVILILQYREIQIAATYLQQSRLLHGNFQWCTKPRLQQGNRRCLSLGSSIESLQRRSLNCGIKKRVKELYKQVIIFYEQSPFSCMSGSFISTVIVFSLK